MSQNRNLNIYWNFCNLSYFKHSEYMHAKYVTLYLGKLVSAAQKCSPSLSVNTSFFPLNIAFSMEFCLVSTCSVV